MKTTATTLQQMRPLLPIRFFNGCGALLEKTRIPVKRALATDLIESAKRRCRLDDFGEGEFFEALTRLLESCQSEARLNLIGKIALRTDAFRRCARACRWSEIVSFIPTSHTWKSANRSLS